MSSHSVFLDTAYAVALSVENDAHFPGAKILALQFKADRTPFVTTRPVMLEIGNTLAKMRYRQAGVALLASLERDPLVEVVPLTEQLFARAFELYRQRMDKEWGLTDCISFIVMQDLSMTDALTTDEHFQQAGFRALLREN